MADEAQRVKVLSVLVGTAARTGGPPAFVGQSRLELERGGDEMVVLSTDLALAPTGWAQSRQRRIVYDERHASLQDGSVRVFAARFPRRLAFSPELYRAACQLASTSDVVHLHNLWQFPQYAGYRAARRAGAPYIVSPHGALDPYLRRHGRGRKWLSTLLYQERLLRDAALIHVTTGAEAELIADVVPGVPRVVVPCGIYVREFRDLPPRQEFRRRYLDGYDGPVILFLGRITYKKGLDRLVRAFAHARHQGECRLVVVGPDDEGLRRGLERLAVELGVARDIDFLGPLFGEDRRAALASADIWALSSYTENFGIAVIEAMAAGCTVCISPEVNVAPDIAAAEAGVVAELEPQAFGEALARLLADDTRRRQLGSAARRFADGYDWSAVRPRLLDMYRRAVA
ncbi:MAG TPA: glycosyltransferase [Solirubrobacteraceae bacterium]|jgi:glycosyltransferase involved in cell wall biosynthesis